MNKLGCTYAPELSYTFLNKYKNKIDWNLYFRHQKKIYPKKFIIEFLSYVDIPKIKTLVIKRYLIGKIDNLHCNDLLLIINSFI